MIDDRLRLILAEFSSTGTGDDLGEFCQIEVGKLLSGDGLRQQLARSGQEYIGKEGLVFGKNSIQKRLSESLCK